jgi:hypothetical protein
MLETLPANLQDLHPTDNKLADPYLPSLRSFVPSHNVTQTNKQIYNEKVKQFKEIKTVVKKKDVHRTVQKEPLSLLEKQQNILLQA